MADIASLLPIILIGAAFWFLILRPQKQRQKAQAQMLRSIAPGTEVMTTAGLFGTVVSSTDEELQLEVAPGVVLRMLPAAVSKIVTAVEPAPTSDPDDAPSA